jgi:hypothetical protein
MIKDRKNTLRLRVESCLGAIIDVHKHMPDAAGEDGVFLQFEELKNTVSQMDMRGVSEMDVVRVEEATNDLLSEFKSLFQAGRYGPIYEDLKQ